MFSLEVEQSMKTISKIWLGRQNSDLSRLTEVVTQCNSGLRIKLITLVHF